MIRFDSAFTLDPDSGRSLDFRIHANGGRPFLVTLRKGALSVYEEVGEGCERTHGKAVAKIGYWKALFPGFDPSGAFHGNTLLVHLTPTSYLFIGPESYYFEPPEEPGAIAHFLTRTGNSDVPYAMAFGMDFLYFFGADGVKMVPQTAFTTPVHPENDALLYQELYSFEGAVGWEDRSSLGYVRRPRTWFRAFTWDKG